MADEMPSGEKSHLENKTLTEHIEYPGHEPRTTSSMFRTNRHILIERLGLGCWVCGSKQNLEAHHWFEWSLWPKLDPAKVLLVLRMIDFYGFAHHKADQPIESPDDIRNLVVLCEAHHRQPETGIHCLEFPIWLPQRAVKEGLTITDTQTG